MIRARSCAAPTSYAVRPIPSSRCWRANGSSPVRWSSPLPIRTCSRPVGEVDETAFARASDIIINDWDSVTANRQVELIEPMDKGLVARENVHTLGDVVAGKAKLAGGCENITYYKNNTGLAMQFAACGAILHRKLLAEGTNRVIPRDWFASGKYGL